jgi:hypothetical protein
MMMRRLQFSLVNALPVIAIAALGAALHLEDAHLRDVETEAARLRSEAGHLSIDNPKQIKVIADRSRNGQDGRSEAQTT